MVTESQYISNGKYMGAVKLYGLSTDSKPTSVGNGSIFIEIDNVGKVDADTGAAVNFTYYFDAENSTWYPVVDAPESDPVVDAPESEAKKTTTRTTKSTAKK